MKPEKQWNIFSTRKDYFPLPCGVASLFLHEKDVPRQCFQFSQILAPEPEHKRQRIRPILVDYGYLSERRKTFKRARITNSDEYSLKFSQQPSGEDTANTNKEFVERINGTLAEMCNGTLESTKMDIICQSLRTSHNNAMSIWKCVDVSGIQEDSIFTLLTEVSKHEDIAFQNHILFLEKLLVKRLLDLKEPASRTLTAAILHAAQVQGNALVIGVLIPLLKKEKLDKPQLDIMTRIVKSGLPIWSVSYMLRTMTQSNHNQPAFTDHSIEILITLLNTLPNSDSSLNASTVQSLLDRLKSSLTVHMKSKKFAQIILTLVVRHGSVLEEEHIIQVRDMAEKNQTFLRKSIINALKPLLK
ncbi:uncharacterized protein VTP21DRAFT_10137 [Calcarisporiella thermophila]|uniref:uncharacterized protein n=1 Tax=Calcarisporiella thermophila TaxID=911321 RepID=UPI003743F7EA